MNLAEKEILQERRRLAWRLYAWAASFVLFVVAVAQGVLYFAGLRTSENVRRVELAWGIILAAGVLALAVAARKAYLFWKSSEQRAGRLLDEKLAASKNRLEASAELIHTNDALALAQRQEAADYLARLPAQRRSYALPIFAACAVALLLLNLTLITKFAILLPKRELAEKDKSTLKVAARDPYAKIDIVAPESETRATPIEEVAVTGAADSDNGFSAVSLEASINGGADKSIPVDPALFNKGGPTKFDASLLLDELGAEPYDVIGYYLKGTSRHATPLKVASQIQFIEVRPFREDIKKGGPEKGGPEVDLLKWLITQEIILSKKTWLISSSQLPATDPTLVSQTGVAGKEQGHVADKTHELYQEMTENGFPALIVDDVQQAEGSMRDAVAKINQPAVPEATPLQQKALGDLVAATKAILKVMDQAQDSDPPTPDPFKDKQKLPTDPNAPRSAVAKLDNLIKREQSVVSKLSSASSDPTAPSQTSSPPNSPASAQSQQAQTSSPPDQGPPGSQSPSQGQGQGQAQAQSQNPSSSQGQGHGQSPSGQQTAQEQSKISRELGEMQNDPNAPASATPAVAEAQQSAQSSADKIAAADQTGALNDARAAEAAMMRAKAAMIAEANQKMRDALAEAQQQLQAAAKQEAATPAPDQTQVKAKVDAAHANLAQQRDEQAAEGDPRLGQIAADLIKPLEQGEIPQALAQLGNQPNPLPQTQAELAQALGKLANQLSADRLAMQTEAQNLEDTLKRIDRVQKNMDGTHGTPEQQQELAQELQSDLNTALSDAHALLPPGSEAGHDDGKPDGAYDGGGKPGGDKPGSAAGGEQPGLAGDEGSAGTGGHGHTILNIFPPPLPKKPADFKPLREPLAAFRLEVEKRLAYLRAQEALSYLNPDQSPEEYRAQVAAYYERISREAKAAPANP